MVICARLISTVAERISDILDDKSSHSASRRAVEKQTTIAKWEEVDRLKLFFAYLNWQNVIFEQFAMKMR